MQSESTAPGSNEPFYDKARIMEEGIPVTIKEKEAQALLLYAFANDAMQNIDIEPLKLKISKLLAEKLEVEIAFEDLD